MRVETEPAPRPLSWREVERPPLTTFKAGAAPKRTAVRRDAPRAKRRTEESRETEAERGTASGSMERRVRTPTLARMIPATPPRRARTPLSVNS
jgi:hypothetical protein